MKWIILAFALCLSSTHPLCAHGAGREAPGRVLCCCPVAGGGLCCAEQQFCGGVVFGCACR